MATKTEIVLIKIIQNHYICCQRLFHDMSLEIDIFVKTALLKHE